MDLRSSLWGGTSRPSKAAWPCECAPLLRVLGTYSPLQAYVMLREFILGNNQTGLVTNFSGTVSVVGGESTSLAAEVLPGQSGIYVGEGSTQSTYTYPSATIAAWESFIDTAIPSPTIAASSSGNIASPSPSQGDGQGSNAESTICLSWMLASLCTLSVVVYHLM